MAALKFSETEFDTDESISLNNRYKIYPPDYSPPHMGEITLAVRKIKDLNSYVMFKMLIGQ